jgi:hypothetical protein
MTDVCAFDGIEERPHRAAEAEGRINHQFSLTGEMRPVEKQKPARPERLVASADPVLRLALIRAGVLTLEDLAGVEVELYGRARVPEHP